MKYIIPLLLALCALPFAGCDSPCGTPAPAESSGPSHFPMSQLDDKPMIPGSLHCARIQSMVDYGTVTLPDGKVIVVFLTGGSNPYQNFGAGTLCASVPSFDDADSDGVYFFQNFSPTKPYPTAIPLKP